jgi:regulator of sigma E protease
MDVLGTIGAFVGVLVILVLVHEVGHFAVAKWSGITVQEFGVGFPPRIASVMWRGTRYSVNWIPLGGFVKMLGEDGEVEASKMREDGMPEEEIGRAMAGAFSRRPVPIRLLVLVAGVAMNFVLAAVLFALALGLPVQARHGPVTVTQVQAESPAEGVLEVGDVIVGADDRTFGRETPTAERFVRSGELTEYIHEQAGNVVRLQVVRDGETITLPVRPRVLTEEQRAAGIGPIGFSWEPERYVEEAPLVDNPVEAIGVGTDLAWTIARQIPGGLAHAIGGLIGLAPQTDAARGPIGIAQVTGEVMEQPLRDILFFVGLLSVNLAVLNILPFPPLDGGRIAVVLIEVVRRGRRMKAEREALIYLTGFAFLIALVILISIQDVRRLFGG